MDNIQHKSIIYMKDAKTLDDVLAECIPQFVKQHCNVRYGAFVEEYILIGAFNIFVKNARDYIPIPTFIPDDMMMYHICKMICRETILHANNNSINEIQVISHDTNKRIFVNIELTSFPVLTKTVYSRIAPNTEIVSFQEMARRLEIIDKYNK